MRNWWYRLLNHFLLKQANRADYWCLRRAGWNEAACHRYLKLAPGLANLAAAQAVGSDLYIQLLRASHLPAHAQLDLILNHHLGAVIDRHRFLQLTNQEYHLDAGLTPRSFFYPYFRELVVQAYPDSRGLRADELGRKVHLFRCYLDRQNLTYLRNYRRAELPANLTDYDRFICYCRDQGLEIDYQTGANYHNRYHHVFDYPRNMKVQLMRDSAARHYNDARMIEFIVDIVSGRFVSEWNVYHQNAAGIIDADPTHYNSAELREIADTESFNYGVPKGVYQLPRRYKGTHRHLDISQPVNSAIRRQAKNYWRFPHDYNHGGSFAELVKDGGDADVQAWRTIPEEERAAVYRDFVTFLQAGHRENHGIKHYLAQKNRNTIS